MRIVLPLLLVLAGCNGQSAVQTATGPGYQVDCAGPLSSKLDCNMRANETCPSGFDPIASPPGHLVFTCSRRPVPGPAPI